MSGHETPETPPPPNETREQRDERLRAARMWPHRQPWENTIIPILQTNVEIDLAPPYTPDAPLDTALGLLAPHGDDISGAL